MKKSHIAMLADFLLVLPLTIYLGIRFLPGRGYYITSTLVIVELLVPFLLAFESRRPQARELVVIAVLSALAVAARVVIPLPNFKAIFAAVLYGSIAFSHPVFLAIAYAAAFAYSVRRGGRRALVFDLCLVPLVLVFALCYAGSHHFGVTVLRQNFIGNRMTAESLVYGLVLGVRAACVCMWCSCLFRVVSSDKVVYLFGRISPRLALFLTILLRLIPRLNREAGRINLAQKGIGRGSDQGNLWERLVHCLHIFSMLITWLIQALALEADSMKSRGSALRGRTAFSIYRFDNRDRAFVVALFSGIILTGMGVILGATAMFYDPVILWKPLTGLAAASAAGYAFLCLLPLGLELWTECRFEKLRRLAAV